MKRGIVNFEYIEKDEYVSTPEGVGIVMVDESPLEDVYDLFYSQIRVKLRDDGKITSVDRIVVTKITKEKYES